MMSALGLMLFTGAAQAEEPVVTAPHPQHQPVAQAVAPAVARLMAAAPKARLMVIPFNGAPAQITGLKVATQGADHEARARDFLARFPVLPAKAGELELVDVRAVAGRHSVMFRQTHGGLPIWERSAVITLNDAGEVVSLTSSLVAVQGVRVGAVSEQEARLKAARAVFGAKADASVTKQAARALVAQQTSDADQVWIVSLSPTADMLRPLAIVSAATGEVLAIRDHSAR